MREEKGNILGTRQQARALARQLQFYALGVNRHMRPEFNEDRRILRRIGLARARQSWKQAVKNMEAAKEQVRNLQDKTKEQIMRRAFMRRALR